MRDLNWVGGGAGALENSPTQIDANQPFMAS